MSDPDPKLVSDAMEAFVDEDYDEARKLYTTLIEQSPEHVAAHVHRSAVNLKLDRFEDALSDAMKALSLDHENPKAYLRKGMALYELERYDPARAAFTIGQTLDPKHAAFKTWIARCEERILEERLADAKQREGPDATIKDATRAPRYKHQWYQSGSHVTIEIMAKGVPEHASFVDVQEDRVTVTVKHADDDPLGNIPYVLDVPLFGKVVPEESRGQVLATKLEIKMKKAEAITWDDLGAEARRNAEATRPNNVSDEGMQRPSYPSSKAANLKKQTDWDKLESDLKKEEKEEDLEGDAALNRMFKGIYENADEDTRRAMNKSFQESNGTVLSTSWKDIGKERTECKPPDCMVEKKYES